ncbi:MAG: ribbon-helix-helix domain-containing protein [Erysipelotrichaceae bacterium]|nr:ribbon-helix-helix domain-containing protein [Erysipelotrichaceae bacterium]
MAYSSDKVRLTVAIDKELNERIEFAAKKLNVSKTKLITELIETNLNNMVTAWELMKNPEYVANVTKIMDSVGFDTSNLTDFGNTVQNDSKAFNKIEKFTDGIKKK